MSENKSFRDMIKDAVAKKHAAQHPDAKPVKSDNKKPNTKNVQKGPPVRRSTGRGG